MPGPTEWSRAEGSQRCRFKSNLQILTAKENLSKSDKWQEKNNENLGVGTVPYIDTKIHLHFKINKGFFNTNFL